MTLGRRGDERHETRGDERRAQRRVRRSLRARVTSRPTDHGARASRRDRPTDHRRRRRRAHGVGGVGVRDGGSEWRRGGRTRGGAGAHTRSAPRHITSLDGRIDGQMEGRKDGPKTNRRTDRTVVAVVHRLRRRGRGRRSPRSSYLRRMGVVSKSSEAESGRRVEALFREV